MGNTSCYNNDETHEYEYKVLMHLSAHQLYVPFGHLIQLLVTFLQYADIALALAPDEPGTRSRDCINPIPVSGGTLDHLTGQHLK